MPFGDGLFYIKGQYVDVAKGHDNNDEQLNEEKSGVNPENEYVEKDDDETYIEEDYMDESNEYNENQDIDNIDTEEDIEEPVLIQEFNTQLPDNIGLQLKYEEYPISYDYLLILKSSNIRELPSSKSKIIGKRGAMEKIRLVSEVRGEYLKTWDKDSWYEVQWEEDGNNETGYIFSALAEDRHFQFDKMDKSIDQLQQSLDFGLLAHISNYKNANGVPPKIRGKTFDSYGHRRSQSAAGYEEPDKSSEFRYIPDGMLLHVLEEQEGFTKVKVVGFEGEYWVLNKYINREKVLTNLNKVVIVDRKYQNQGVFELEDGRWNLISYGFSTTGKTGKYSLETPLGFYTFIEKRDRFYYFEDGTTKIAGYAPYAARFSGGGYIHGVPVNYKMEGDKIIDPGKQEYLHSIGTIPKSHMCIRNYTSHAKFLHSWIDIGETAIVIIE